MPERERPPAELNLPVGSWLHELKRAVINGLPDDHTVDVPASKQQPAHKISLGELRAVLTVTPGQKIGM